MKARSKYISLLLAVLMAITMSPLLSQEALAEKETHEVNMYNGVVCVDDNLTIDTTQYLDEDGDALVYAYYSTDGYKDFFNYRGPGTTIYSYQVPDMFSLGEQFYIVIENSYERIESEWITIKMNAKNLDFSEFNFDKTYTGKKLYLKSFDLDLGPTYFVNKDFKITYSNNINVGRAAAKLTANDSRLIGSKIIYFNIRPKGTSIKFLSRSKKCIIVKWKAQKAQMSKSRISGYQIQYSTKSNFKGAKVKNVEGYKKTSKLITGLARKTKYYVRVRTYMTVKGVKYYSSWSKTKAIKTK